MVQQQTIVHKAIVSYVADQLSQAGNLAKLSGCLYATTHTHTLLYMVKQQHIVHVAVVRLDVLHSRAVAASQNVGPS